MLPPVLNIPKWSRPSPLTSLLPPPTNKACKKNRLEANAHLLQPPINNYCVYHPSTSAGYTVMIVGGPNARTDYHINPTPEFFYQYRGSMLLKTVDQNTSPPSFVDVPIHEGSMFLLPANTPHCPVRFEGTIGVVMEQPRPEGAEDAMRWYCRNTVAVAGGEERCARVVWEKRFVCSDLGTQVKAVVEEFAADEEKRTCKGCGAVAAVRYAEGEVVQP